MSEQQSQIATTTTPATTTSACPHPEAVGQRWGDPISEERQAELQGYLDRWATETDHGERKGPFDKAKPHDRFGVQLTGADVSWLAQQSLVGRARWRSVPDLHLEGAKLEEAHLEGAELALAHLEGAYLHGAHLEGAYLEGAYLHGASLGFAHLEGAYLRSARLRSARLETANLEGADLRFAELEDANLEDARLEGVQLEKAHLEGANLRGAWLDSKTAMREVTLNWETSLGDIQWGGVGAVNLTQINWDRVHLLGDEFYKVDGLPNTQRYEAAVRAYRQVAAQLRAQGMSEAADRFAYRAQVRQRVVLRHKGVRGWAAAFGSWFLDLISGHGYKPMRSFITYVLVILAFAAAYLALGTTNANGSPLQWNEAVVISMTAFHGRGFFSAVFQPGDIQAAVAAVEAFIGLLIEIVFIATFTQRFFAR